MPGSVAYLVRTWPRLTQTFVLDEVLNLERLGIDVRLFALSRGDEPLVQPEVAAVLAPVVSGLVLPPEVYAGLADLALVVHLAFILFVAIGAFVAWRWPPLRWVHILAVAYAAAIVTVGFDCPLTGLEKQLRRLAGGPVMTAASLATT